MRERMARYGRALWALRWAVLGLTGTILVATAAGTLFGRGTAWAGIAGTVVFMIAIIVGSLGYNAGDAAIPGEQPGYLAMSFTLVVLAGTIAIGVTPLYQAACGLRTDAVVTGTGTATDEFDGAWISYRVAESGTGRDLGWLLYPPAQKRQVGEQLDVYTDPRAWFSTVPVAHSTGVAVATKILGWGALLVAAGLVGARVAKQAAER